MTGNRLVKYGTLVMVWLSYLHVNAGENIDQIHQNGKSIIVQTPNYKASFSSSGVSLSLANQSIKWTWKLIDKQHTHQRPTIIKSENGTKVILERNGYQEIYILKEKTIEQQFRIIDKAAFNGDIVISGEINCNGLFEDGQSHWTWSQNGKTIALGDVYTFDNNGKEVRSKMHVNSNSSTIIIKKEDLENTQFPIVVDPEIGDETVVLSSTPSVTKPTAVYNSVNDVVLAIWSEPKSDCSENIELRGQKLNPQTGEKVGESFLVYEATGNCAAVSLEIPKAVYDPQNNRYFVILKSVSGSSKKVIGLIVDQNGSQVGNTLEFASSTFGDPYNHLLARYDPVNQSFLAGYHVQVGASEMTFHLQKVNANTGEKTGGELVIDKSNIPVSGNSGPKSSQIIFDENSEKLVHVFHVDDASTSEVWGTIIDPSDLSLIGDFFQISPDGLSSDRYKNPSIIFNEVADECLVVFEDVDLVAGGYEQVANIYGQKISSSDGSKTGSRKLISKIPLTGCPGCIEQAKLPKISFSPIKNEFLLTFYGIPTSSGNEIYDIYGSRLSPNDLSIIDDESFSMLPSNGTTVIDNNNLLGHEMLYFGETDKYLLIWLDQQLNSINVQVRKYQNHQPTDLSISNRSIDENMSVQSTIGNFITIDLDDDDNFTYSLIAGEGDSHNSLFAINGNELRSNQVFNFENGNQKSIRVRSIDSFGESVEKSLIINVQDVNEHPTDISLSKLSIQEFTPVGTTVGSLSAEDPDQNSTFSYELVSGNEFFKIEWDELKTNAVLDYGVVQNIPIKIKAIDNSDLEFEKNFEIEIEEFPDFEPPAITSQDFRETYTFSNANESVSIQATDDHGIEKVLFYHRKITESEFSSIELEADNSQYAVSITKDKLDDLGMVYFFEVADVKHKVYSDTIIMTYTFQDNDISLANLDFGGKEEDYQIIAIPYELDNPSISDIFEDQLGKQSPELWRLLRYEDENCCREYPTSLAAIDRGKGYWFNQKYQNAIALGSGKVSYDPEQEYFEIELAAGWNQIGNPFPFEINWPDVVEFDLNGDKFSTGKVSNSIFQYVNGSFVKDGALPAFHGAFLSAEESISIKIPLRTDQNSNGRIAKEALENSLDEEHWEVPILMHKGNASYSIGAIGMHPDASSTKDRFDELAIPRFGNFLEYTFDHPEYFYSRFSKDIVPTQESYIWHFTASSKESGRNIFIWNNDYFGSGRNELILIDISNSKVIDMRTQSKYEFQLNGDRKFELIYGDQTFIRERLKNIKITADNAYPNPFSETIHIPLILPSNDLGYEIDLDIYNSNGIKVYRKAFGDITENFVNLTWNINDQSSNHINTGIYIYKLTVKNTGEIFTGKVVKK